MCVCIGGFKLINVFISANHIRDSLPSLVVKSSLCPSLSFIMSPLEKPFSVLKKTVFKFVRWEMHSPTTAHKLAPSYRFILPINFSPVRFYFYIQNSSSQSVKIADNLELEVPLHSVAINNSPLRRLSRIMCFRSFFACAFSFVDNASLGWHFFYLFLADSSQEIVLIGIQLYVVRCGQNSSIYTVLYNFRFETRLYLYRSSFHEIPLNAMVVRYH